MLTFFSTIHSPSANIFFIADSYLKVLLKSEGDKERKRQREGDSERERERDRVLLCMCVYGCIVAEKEVEKER